MPKQLSDDYKCVVADERLLTQKWDKEIAKHDGAQNWVMFKESSLKNMDKRIVYLGILDGEIITQATAVISEKDPDTQNKDGLVGTGRAYLCAFRTDKEYEGQGYFSKLYKYMEQDLKKRGFEALTLGVEPCEVRNMLIYFNWGYTDFIKSEYEVYPAANPSDSPVKVMVNYYLKKI